MDIQPITTEETVTADRPWLLSLHGSDTAKTVTLDLSKFVSGVHYTPGTTMVPANRIKSGMPLGKVTASGLYAPFAGMTNEVQTVTITGSPTGGTYTLTFSGQTTAAIAYNATAAQVRTALEALSNIAPGDVTVAGGPHPGTAITVTFGGQYLGDDVAQMTAAGSLTGGTTPAVAVTTTTAGGAAGASDGTQILAGLLFTEVAFNTGSTKVGAPMLIHGDVATAKLPLPFEVPAAANRTDSIHFS